MISKCKIEEFGNKRWRLPNGDLHREDDLPAVEAISGSKSWYKNNKLHRDNDKPAYEGPYGDKFWYINGKFHRDDNKPAVEYVCGKRCWYVNGVFHRTNGAAIENPDGSKEWILEGVRYSEKEYNEKVKKYL